MAHGDAREGKWRGNWRMEWVASTLHTTSEHGVSSITTADAHTWAASSRLNWHPCRFKRTSPCRWKTKYGFCACAITFQTQSIKTDNVLYLGLDNEECSRNLFCRVKGITIVYSEYVFVTLVIQNTKRMRPIIWSSVACPLPPHLFAFLINVTIFEKTLLNIKCVFWFLLQYFSEVFLIPRSIQGDIIVKVHRSPCKVPAILAGY